MGALKGRFQSLHGLRVNINSNDDHWEALRWITVAIILHNAVTEFEGMGPGAAFAHRHSSCDEEEDHSGQDEPRGGDNDGVAKRGRLTEELLAYRARRNNN
jgi:hypothetical protein